MLGTADGRCPVVGRPSSRTFPTTGADDDESDRRDGELDCEAGRGRAGAMRSRAWRGAGGRTEAARGSGLGRAWRSLAGVWRAASGERRWDATPSGRAGAGRLWARFRTIVVRTLARSMAEAERCVGRSGASGGAVRRAERFATGATQRATSACLSSPSPSRRRAPRQSAGVVSGAPLRRSSTRSPPATPNRRRSGSGLTTSPGGPGSHRP
jgi:hypothetical protein